MGRLPLSGGDAEQSEAEGVGIIGPYGGGADLFRRAHGMRPYGVGAGLVRRAHTVRPYGVSAGLLRGWVWGPCGGARIRSQPPFHFGHKYRLGLGSFSRKAMASRTARPRHRPACTVTTGRLPRRSWMAVPARPVAVPPRRKVPVQDRRSRKFIPA